MSSGVRFDQYVDWCLYGPDGFYSSGRGSAGRRRDFITSPEVGPLFGAVIASWLDDQWDALGQPEEFPVVDVGAGPGTLQKALQLAAPRCAAAWQLQSADVAPGGSTLPEDLSGAVVIANELLDNLPFRMARKEVGKIDEAFVSDSGGLVWEPLAETLAFDTRHISDDEPFPVLERANRFVSDLLERGAARVLVFDYGTKTTAELAGRGGWLRTYREQQRGGDALLDPGYWDITTDIAEDQLPIATESMTQAEFLHANGIETLVAEGRAHWAENAARPDLAAMRMRSRVSESEALLHPDGLGSWRTLIYQSG